MHLNVSVTVTGHRNQVHQPWFVSAGHREARPADHHCPPAKTTHERLRTPQGWPPDIDRKISYSPWRIRMYGRLMLTWLGDIDGKCYHDHGIHTDPMGKYVKYNMISQNLVMLSTRTCSNLHKHDVGTLNAQQIMDPTRRSQLKWCSARRDWNVRPTWMILIASFGPQWLRRHGALPPWRRCGLLVTNGDSTTQNGGSDH